MLFRSVALEPAPSPGQEQRFEFAPALQRALAQASATLGCTPFALLLAAYGQALQTVFGARRRFVSTPFSRRIEPELTEPIGYLLDLRFIEGSLKNVGRALLPVAHPCRFLPG